MKRGELDTDMHTQGTHHAKRKAEICKSRDIKDGWQVTRSQGTGMEQMAPQEPAQATPGLLASRAAGQ